MAIKTAKMSKLRFIESIPSRGLLLQFHSAIGTKGDPPSLADSAAWANGTSVITVTIIRTICLWYRRTVGQISKNLDVAPVCHALLPCKFPRALRSEIRRSEEHTSEVQ